MVLLTRTRHFASKLQPQFARGEVEKVYLVRVQGTVRLRLADGRIVRFKDLLSAPGQRWDLFLIW